MAVYTCHACNQIFDKRLTITYLSWYKGEELIRYRLSMCADCTDGLRIYGPELGALRQEDGSWLGPQAKLPGQPGPRTSENRT